ncbi:MAG: hypothetical protein HQL30_05615 [Candidatus Omnitrophica bacterium]|nr:hypothetical protein [Candidatus Omnitrophota bacterium]
MRRITCYTMSFFLALFLFGCAGIDVPNPGQIVKNPIGPSAVKIGMTKAEVSSIYGEPDYKDSVTSNAWTGERDEWFYKARISPLPVGADYLAEDLYLYFDGVSLTKISKTHLGDVRKKKE